MPRVFGSRRRPGLAIALGILVSLYAWVFAVVPVLHHSDACHATTPMHCTACALQMTSPSVEDNSIQQTIALLPDAGKLLPETISHDRAPLVTHTKDRSPPA